MIIGVPTETKPFENRVAITPDGVRELCAGGHAVVIQAGAGEASSITDAEYAMKGAEIGTIDDAWTSDLVVKVKEPQPSEFGRLTESTTLFTYLHLAAYPKVADALIEGGATGVAYETVELKPFGDLPLLAPMSEVAGRLATQIGAHYLQRNEGGRGVLLGGAPGVQPGRVLVLGAGNVGWNSAWIAAGMEAEVLLVDKNLDRLRYTDQIHKGRIMTLASNRGSIERVIAEADVVIGAVLVAGGRAPMVVSEEMVAAMRPGSVIVDVAIDQGGCIETSRETTHAEPTYVKHDVIHYAVGNIPAVVPNTSTFALTNATLPYIRAIADKGLRQAVVDDPALGLGVNTVAGSMANPAVAEALGREAVDPLTVL